MPTHATGALEIGLILPVFENDMHGRTARWSDLQAMATCAEEVGFDSLWVVDHLLSERAEQVGRPRQGPWECWSILAAIAATTSRIRFGPLVGNTSFRNPALLAKTAETIDEMSGGRLILGLGAGWHEPEYRAFGFPFDRRFDRFEEALNLIHGLLRDGRVDFSGHYHRAEDCELHPRGPRPAGPPIMIGTNAAGPRVLSMAARYADMINIWTVWMKNRPDDLPPINERIDAACAEIGRAPESLARTAAIRIDLPGRLVSPDESISPITGSPQQIAETLHRYREMRISHVNVWLEPNSVAGVEQFATVMERLEPRG
jgi:alkanesulfonate monooxygenase SsuD/methylene tetrahydromethanopterin reductase-like flavin-dependent oxidoreductase (luciferase family)